MKERIKRIAPWLGFLALLALMAAARGLEASADISYNITNGDFQNYDPVRRLLAGQAPYRDFTVYLGAGELYSVAAVLLAVGDSFGRSVFAASMLTWFFYELLIFAVAAAVFGRARPAAAFTLGLSGWYFLAASGFSVPLSGLIGQVLGYGAAVGNSARMIRAGALPLAVLLIAGGLHLWQKKGERPLLDGAQGLTGQLRALLRWPLHPAVLVPLTAGALVPWSNDVGGSMYIAVALAYGLFLLRIHRTDLPAVLRATLGYIAVSVAGLGVSVTLISWGHPFAWLRQTRGTGSDQVWYYATDPDNVLCYLSDFTPTGWFWGGLALTVLFGVLLLAAKDRRAAVQAGGCFAFSLGFAVWEFLYAVGSGSQGGPSEGGRMLVGILIPAALVLALSRLPWPALLRRAVPFAAVLTACAAAALGLWQQFACRETARQDLTWQPELQGWIGDQAEKLETERTVTAGGAVFSTYAGGIECVTGQFQPTGTDYIIHALGDRSRAAYLQTFQTGDHAYVLTPSPKVSNYERWARNANWWFYSELYRYWQPVGTTFGCGGMHLIWQRTGTVNDLGQPTSVTLTRNAANQVTLTVTAADPAFCGVADVTLDYAVTLPGSFPLRGGLHSYLFVDCVTEEALWQQRGREGSAGFSMPVEKTRWSIPVTLENGSGTVVLTALPGDAASLTVSAAEVTATYNDWTYFFE